MAPGPGHVDGDAPGGASATPPPAGEERALRLPRSELVVVLLYGGLVLVPPVLWSAFPGSGAVGSVAAALALVGIFGVAVVGLAVALDRAAWTRQFVGIGTAHPPIPETEVGARIHGAVRSYEGRLAHQLAAHETARVAAEDADRFETEFARNLSHELRTPLNAILGFTHVLLDELDGPLTPAQREDIETIRSSGVLLRELVDDVLDLAALQSGRVGLERARIDVEPVLREVTRLLSGQLGGKQVDLVVEVARDTPLLHVDPKRLRQILVNLGTNAVKFTERGRIVFRGAPHPQGVRLTVEDTGPGIPREELPALFDEFHQLAGAVRKGQGAGLGLAIVRRLSELHGGRVGVESRVGVGSRFHVVLPAARPGDGPDGEEGSA